MKQTYGLAGLVVLGLALADWTAPVWAQSSTKKPPAGEALPVAPTLDPLPLPAPPNPNAPAAETKPAAPGQPPEPATVRQDPAVSLEWIGPTEAKVGRPSDYTVAVRNVCNVPVQQVLVRVQVPPGTRVTETEPKANVEGDVLWWELGTLTAKQQKNLLVRMVPDGKGNLACHAWVTFTGAAAIRIKVSEPRLALKLMPPEKVMLGDNAVFQFAISNLGDGVAEQVKIHANLSDGLDHPAGKNIDFDVGTLGPKESRLVQLVCKTKAGGEQKCEGVAEAKGDLRAKDRVCVTIAVPKLDVEVTGPKLRYLDRKAVYSFKITNPGDGPANQVTVTNVIPAGFEFTSASEGGRPDPATRTVSWVIGEIPPGKSKEVKLEVLAVSPGEHHHKVTVQADRGIKVDGDVLTRVEGLSALTLEVMETDNPVEVGATTSYEIRITNTGSKPDTDIRLVAFLPEKVQFKSATGPTKHLEQGKEIVFEPLPRLAPRADAIYRVTVKTLTPGDVRFKAQITSANVAEPVVEMQATRIYED